MSKPQFFELLEARTAAARERLEATPVVAQCLLGQVQRETYQAFLVEAYHHVKHTVPLLMACGARLPERLEWLRADLVHYIDEEVGHQEWILNDLAELGVDRNAVRNGQPSPDTELMVSYAYDGVARGNPVSLLGMVYTLEKTSATIATLAARHIQHSLSLPPAAMTYMVSHGSLDVAHLQHYARLVNRLDDDADRKAVLHGAAMFYELYTRIFRALPLTFIDSEEASHAA